MVLAAVKQQRQHHGLQPPLKWAGGKRWLLPHLLPLWQHFSHHRLVEPFCGGLAVGLGLNPQQALLNDINPHLINFYEQLQNGLIIRENFKNDRAYYFAVREKFNSLIETNRISTKAAAQWFYYLNRTGFNGLCRFNQSGFYNVPFGRYKTINYKKEFSAYTETFAHWDFSQEDFSQLSIKKNDFIYADPPYDVEFVSYSKGGFKWLDQLRLAEWLAKQPCPVVTSNQATERIIKLYTSLGFTITLLDAPRRIACNGDRRPAKEMLAIKF